MNAVAKIFRVRVKSKFAFNLNRFNLNPRRPKWAVFGRRRSKTVVREFDDDDNLASGCMDGRTQLHLLEDSEFFSGLGDSDCEGVFEDTVGEGESQEDYNHHRSTRWRGSSALARYEGFGRTPSISADCKLPWSGARSSEGPLQGDSDSDKTVIPTDAEESSSSSTDAPLSCLTSFDGAKGSASSIVLDERQVSWVVIGQPEH